MTAEVSPLRLESTSLVELAVHRLRGEILSGALAPGERLVEEQLRTRFGTSRAPLREALRLLGQQGLVEHLPRRGVRVAQLSARDIEELFTLRDVLERFAVQCALGGGHPADPDAMTALADAVDRMDAAVHAGDAVAQDAAHRAFHIGLVGLAGHRHLFEAYEPVIHKLQLYMATNMRREADERPPESGPARHRRLYDAIAAGDLDLVLAELDAHGAQTYLAPELHSP